MIMTQILKPSFTSALIILLAALQMSACSLEENPADTATIIDPGNEIDLNTNSPAVIGGVDNANLTEDVDPDADNLLEVSRILNITDSDAGEAAFLATTVSGSYGSLAINAAGSWNYAASNSQAVIQNLASGAILTDSLTVSSIDGTTHTVVITIFGADEVPGANSPAVISGVDKGSVTEDVDPDIDNLLEVGGKLNITDSDAGEAAFVVKTLSGSYGNLVIGATGSWNYAASNSQAVIQNLVSGATLTDSLTVSSIDGTTHKVVITIFGADEVPGANSPAVISGVDKGSVTEDVDPDADNLLEVGGKLNITDSDAGEAAFVVKTLSGSYGNLVIGTTGSWNYAASNSQAVIQNLVSGAILTDSLTVSSIDGTTHKVVITILGADEIGALNVSLSWIAPVEREDNSPILLSEIAGYKVYYGAIQGQYPNNITVNDSAAEGYVVTGFSTGTYYFVVTTFDVDGRESQYSPEVTVVL